MCEYYGLPLALIFEELVDIDKPEDKAQEQRPAEAEQEQQSKGTANRQPPPLCLRQIFSRRPCALYRPLRRFHASCVLDTPASLNGLQRPLWGLYGLVRVFRSIMVLPPPPGAIIWYIPAPSAKLRPRKKRASEGVFFTRSIQGLFLCLLLLQGRFKFCKDFF